MSILFWTSLILLQICIEVSSLSACGNAHSIALCSCWRIDDWTWAVNCTGLALRALPTEIPVNTTYLYAGTNNLAEIDNDTLLRLPILHHIVLDYNKLSTLPKFPKGIRTISANYNNIESIDGAFQGLTALARVALNSNKIKIIKNTTFQDSKGLLNLSPNILSGTLQIHKDKPPAQSQSGVYRIPCECGKVYIGKTRRDLGTGSRNTNAMRLREGNNKSHL
ncbi:leucine-rich repeats and immunoglobulin-like domains protein 1 [Anneissia japonica]|uniref:leucine-rich repeats and immunoglobulin-like domains protein 1 n=1 Tax=Anneissia japonica TaxID=1529436 RepID=UPI0014257045|nr:leucine-rich repeats and immunoglobulin-like domains protein 1 [Anneissia japonica]